MPATSRGFWVAMTKNSVSRGRVTLSTVTCFSAMASSIAACTLGEVRLISSASTTWANRGPGRKAKSPVPGSNTETPVMSEGSRSGVNWMRRKGGRSRPSPSCRASPRALARVVLPEPG